MKQTIDLLSPRERYSVSARTMIHFLGLATALFFFIALMMVVWSWYKAHQLEQWDKRLQGLVTQKPIEVMPSSQANPEEQEYQALQTLFNEAKIKASHVKQINKLYFSQGMAQLATMGRKGLWLQSFNFNNQDQSLSFQGQADSPQTVLLWLHDLSVSPLFIDSGLTLIKVKESGDRYQFDIEGKL